MRSDRSSEYLVSLVHELCKLPRETEWLGLPADCDWWAGARWRCCTGRAPGRGENRATSAGLTWQDRPGAVVDGALRRE